MAQCIIIAGDTGTGKSTSLQNLDPKTNYIISTLDKPLPFKGSNSMYNTENKNYAITKEYGDVLQILNAINDKPEIKSVILDDIGFVMQHEYFKRASETGFTKFTLIAQHMQQIIDAALTLRRDLKLVFMFHSEIGGEFGDYLKLKLMGRMLEDKFNPLATVSVCLFTNVSFGKGNIPEYKFVTNRASLDGKTVPAKSPMGMFDELLIDNDLNTVFKAIDEYYG